MNKKGRNNNLLFIPQSYIKDGITKPQYETQRFKRKLGFAMGRRLA